jgi:3-deoxy-manno-octulosonate cytidylyltransferase (CMP-KDO synthetase)
MRTPFTVLIPARLTSTRLPDKPLANIGGVPMVVRVAQRARLSGAQRVVVATDSARIVAACAQHSVESVLTRSDHPSGSDRLAEASALLGLSGEDIVVNVQGDEPLIDPQLVQAVATLLAMSPGAAMGTAAHPIHDRADFLNPNVVKVVLNRQQMALYFSRAPIAYARDTEQGWPGDLPSASTAPSAQGALGALGALGAYSSPLRHIGLYAYRAQFLQAFPGLDVSPLETIEALEQLRALWHGYAIAVHVSPTASAPGVDTPADLERVRAFVQHQQENSP